MKPFTILLFLMFLWTSLMGQQMEAEKLEAEYYGVYLGLEYPDSIPLVFAPDLISGKGRMHSFVSFSPDLKTMYWSSIPPKIMMMQMVDNKWNTIETAPFSNTNNNQAPFVAADHKIYFTSSRNGGFGHLDLWYTINEEGCFIEPINVGETINSKQLETHPTVSNNHHIYYTGSIDGKLYHRGIYCSTFENGAYTKAILLPYPINIMDSTTLDYTPFIAADESYLLFCSNRQNPEIELCHIYISYKNEEGEWGQPIDLSEKMGFTESSKFPYVTPDKRFLLFSSGENIYWVDAKTLLLDK